MGVQLPKDVAEMDYGLQTRSKPQDSIQPATSGKTNGQVLFDSNRLMAMMVGTQQKIIVPQSLLQEILKECHDVPSMGHVGMRRTLELVDRQFQ